MTCEVNESGNDASALINIPPKHAVISIDETECIMSQDVFSRSSKDGSCSQVLKETSVPKVVTSTSMKRDVENGLSGNIISPASCVACSSASYTSPTFSMTTSSVITTPTKSVLFKSPVFATAPQEDTQSLPGFLSSSLRMANNISLDDMSFYNHNIKSTTSDCKISDTQLLHTGFLDDCNEIPNESKDITHLQSVNYVVNKNKLGNLALNCQQSNLLTHKEILPNVLNYSHGQTIDSSKSKPIKKYKKKKNKEPLPILPTLVDSSAVEESVLAYKSVLIAPKSKINKAGRKHR